ncbi:MAG: vanadium-dependent haloperoxidase [Gemmatimonadota bacterium]
MYTTPHCRASRVLVAATALVVAACSPDAGPLSPAHDAVALKGGVSATIGRASPAWQALAVTMVSQASYSPLQAARAYPLVGVAQYRAVQRAEASLGVTNTDQQPASANGVGAGGRTRLEADRGAVAGASAAVLAYLFPSRLAEIAALVSAQANTGPGGVHPAFVAGEAIGRAVGAEMVARAAADNFSAVVPLGPPAGPGYWISNTAPATTAGSQLPGVTPWFLTSASQFRAAPPPPFGSAAFLAARNEIRQIADTRTAQQSQIAGFWALNNGTPTASGFWMQQASDAISQADLTERQATHVYALTSAAMLDAAIGCWESKILYWYIRPYQADPGITVLASVGRPNHPSYPSGHSCVSGAGAAVLASLFPAEADRLNAMVVEAGLSRMYGGIHYRFDCDAGQLLGRQTAAFAIAADASGQSPLTDH